ncbi:hypothetical protein HPP92_009936 [Vanilla planifolia]|uniref:non-specific serine/threonine protein kinase n=1 Tax=Vanilla planifolia TaxID=51239 RepID=A0A835V1D1_VANPL|nr:hypothetical protein HPP92_009936 [Vanilla planifolia]
MLYNNSLQGSIAEELFGCKNITRVNLSNNQLNGSILPLCGSSSLISFDLTNNSFSLQIPAQLGNSPFLERIRLGSNQLVGEIPSKLGRIQSLRILDLSGNQLTGEIPRELSSCTRLTHIDLNSNGFTGQIPVWLGGLLDLGELKLSSNGFTGPLPIELFNCSELLQLHLDDNQLNGSLPIEIGKFSSLNVLDITKNRFSGEIPASIGKMSKLYDLRLSHNSFNGEIPAELGELSELQSTLDLSFNNLVGTIPSALQSLNKLEALDLSHNRITGEIPHFVGRMSSLVILNLSYNNLTGKLDGDFSRWPPETFVGNVALCGRPLQQCAEHTLPNRRRHATPSTACIAVVAALVTVVVLLLIIAIAIALKRKASRKAVEVNCTYSSSSSHVRRQLIPKGSGRREFRWDTIMEATKNLSDEHMIGAGGSGSVYRAELPSGEIVAVKRIYAHEDSEFFFADKCFASELKTLGRIRHRHLVKLMGFISGGNGGNLLVYEYMENGSVWDWLHCTPAGKKKKRVLGLEARLMIALGLAKGVEYLHHDCVPRILHRDIKTSNILLDSDLEAHLGDFGLAKVLVAGSRGCSESASLFAGSYGYIAPEYAYTMKATEKADLYSMGIVLMELMSGVMPTDQRFGGEMDMVRWVESRFVSPSPAVAPAWEEVVDPSLKPLIGSEEAAVLDVLEVALQCTKTVPSERPTARKVADVLTNVARKIRKERCGKSTAPQL